MMYRNGAEEYLIAQWNAQHEDGTIGTPIEGEEKMMPAFHDEQWIEFKRICQDTGILPGGESDWLWAAHAWTQLDLEQRCKALADVQERSLKDFTISRALPQNYLKGRYWTRPHTAPARQRHDPAAIERHNERLLREQEEQRDREAAMLEAFEAWWQSRSPEEQARLFAEEKRALLARCPSLRLQAEYQYAGIVHAGIRVKAMRAGLLEVRK